MKLSEPKRLVCGTHLAFEDVKLGRRARQFDSKGDDERVRCVAGPRNHPELGCSPRVLSFNVEYRPAASNYSGWSALATLAVTASVAEPVSF